MPRLSRKPSRGSVSQYYLSPKQISFGLRLFLLIGGAFLIISLGALIWRSGWLDRRADNITKAFHYLTEKMNFSIKDIVVEGRQYTERSDLFQALQATASLPIFAFDTSAAHERLKKLPWVAEASVERRLPNTIYVRLTERQPIARWQNENRTVLVDREGKKLTNIKPEAHPQLPLIVGPGAPEQAKILLQTLENFPTIAKITKAAVRVGDRRWDLYLEPKLVIKLPEQNMDTALTVLDQLIRDQKVLERDMASIDLRLPDRWAFEPNTPPQAGDLK